MGLPPGEGKAPTLAPEPAVPAFVVEEEEPVVPLPSPPPAAAAPGLAKPLPPPPPPPDLEQEGKGFGPAGGLWVGVSSFVGLWVSQSLYYRTSYRSPFSPQSQTYADAWKASPLGKLPVPRQSHSLSSGDHWRMRSMPLLQAGATQRRRSPSLYRTSFSRSSLAPASLEKCARCALRYAWLYKEQIESEKRRAGVAEHTEERTDKQKEGRKVYNMMQALIARYLAQQGKSPRVKGESRALADHYRLTYLHLAHQPFEPSASSSESAYQKRQGGSAMEEDIIKVWIERLGASAGVWRKKAGALKTMQGSTGAPVLPEENTDQEAPAPRALTQALIDYVEGAESYLEKRKTALEALDLSKPHLLTTQLKATHPPYSQEETPPQESSGSRRLSARLDLAHGALNPGTEHTAMQGSAGAPDQPEENTDQEDHASRALDLILALMPLISRYGLDSSSSELDSQAHRRGAREKSMDEKVVWIRTQVHEIMQALIKRYKLSAASLPRRLDDPAQELLATEEKLVEKYLLWRKAFFDAWEKANAKPCTEEDWRKATGAFKGLPPKLLRSQTRQILGLDEVQAPPCSPVRSSFSTAGTQEELFFAPYLRQRTGSLTALMRELELAPDIAVEYMPFSPPRRFSASAWEERTTKTEEAWESHSCPALSPCTSSSQVRESLSMGRSGASYSASAQGHHGFTLVPINSADPWYIGPGYAQQDDLNLLTVEGDPWSALEPPRVLHGRPLSRGSHRHSYPEDELQPASSSAGSDMGSLSPDEGSGDSSGQRKGSLVFIDYEEKG